MLIRAIGVLTLIAMFVAGALTSPANHTASAPPLQSARGLEATVQTLETQVADQELRIRSLEVVVGMLLVREGLDPTNGQQPTPVGGLDIRSPQRPTIKGIVILPPNRGAFTGQTPNPESATSFALMGTLGFTFLSCLAYP